MCIRDSSRRDGRNARPPSASEKGKTYKGASVLVALLLSSLAAYATIFGTVSGLIHDPQHRPVQGAQVTLHAANSAWTKSVSSNESGEFRFDSVPLGEYSAVSYTHLTLP